MSEYVSQFDDALGVYVGPATFADIVSTLGDHSPGKWVMQLKGPNGEFLWHKDGWSWKVVESDEYVVFAVARSEQGAGIPSLYVDAPLVLTFLKTEDGELSAACSLYSGGLVLDLGFGDYAGHTLTLVVWHDVWHVAESGELAPGFGAFEIWVDDGEEES